MSNEKSLKAQEPEIRAALENGKIAEFETHGFSMIPLLHDGGDRVQLKKPDGRLAVNDVALCITHEDKYVLHRVVGFRDGGYVLRGDNCLSCEFCADDSKVIGVAVGFIRRGRFIDVNSFSYKCYCRFRRPLLKLWQRFWKIIDKIVEIKSK